MPNTDDSPGGQQEFSMSSRDPHRAEFIDRFEMEHLISLTGVTNSRMDPNDGLYRLKQREMQSGVVTLRCIVALIVRHNRKEIMVKNSQSGEEMESFPLSIVSTIFFRRSLDPNETYNNKVVIILSQSPRNLDEVVPEMHIFQSIRTPADEVVERINDFKVMKLSPDDYPPLTESQIHGSHAHLKMHLPLESPRQYTTKLQGGLMVVPSPSSSNRKGQSPQERLEREIYLINRCFEDIDKFMAKLQRAVKIYNDIKEKMAKTTRGTKKNKKNIQQIFNFTVGTRAQLPTEDEFIECLKLIKLSLNLLARLSPNQSIPNRVDSTLAIFSILQVVGNSCRDTSTKEMIIARRVVSPLMNKRTVELLQEVLGPREKAFWKELGEAWITPREEWHREFVPSYLPVFSDGFTPTLWDYDEEVFAGNTPTTVTGATY